MRQGRADRWERAWIAAVLAWSGVRIAAVATLLDRYGVNPWWYAAIDLGSSVPYGLSSSRTLRALHRGDRRRALGWGGLTAVAFAAPDVYIVWAGRALPWVAYAVVGTIFFTAAWWVVRSGRRANAVTSLSDVASASPAV